MGQRLKNCDFFQEKRGNRELDRLDNLHGNVSDMTNKVKESTKALDTFLTNIQAKCEYLLPIHRFIIIRKKKKTKIVNILLSVSLRKCFGCSKEPSHLEGSFEYPQHMFWLRNLYVLFCMVNL